MSKFKGIYFRDFNNSYIPHILKELYIERVYRNYIEQRDDQVIIDCGGNIGLFTMYAYPFAKKIYIIEPSKDHQEVIEHMIKENGMEDKVVLVKKAISHKNGTATFYHNNNVTMFSLKAEVNDNPESKEEVETITFDKLFEEYNIDHVDFLKLDVEGSECEILGSEGFQKVSEKIDSLVTEYHDWSGRNPSHIDTTLRDLGYKVEPIPADAVLFGGKRSND